MDEYYLNRGEGAKCEQSKLKRTTAVHHKICPRRYKASKRSSLEVKREEEEEKIQCQPLKSNPLEPLEIRRVNLWSPIT